MEYKRVLTVQDISCVGQCSITAALPILSAAGHETAILPSSVLSTHTTGFYGFTCRDLTEDMPGIIEHWKKTGITFDAIVTGYIGDARQIDYITDIIKSLRREDFVSIIDPAMADNGILYPAFDMAFVEEMKRLVFQADMILPNITEACFLTGTEFRTEYDEAYIDGILSALRAQGAKTIILTGVSYSEDTIGIVVLEGDNKQYVTHRKSPRSSHGTGDVYTAAFAGAYLKGFSACDAAGIAGEYTVRCIENTVDDPDHWYGVKFEPVLGEYISMLNQQE